MQIKKSSLIFASVLLGILLVTFVSAKLPTKISFIQPSQEPTLGTYYPECSEVVLRSVPSFEDQPSCWTKDCDDPAGTGKSICKDGNTSVSSCKDMCDRIRRNKKCDWTPNMVTNCQAACTTQNGCNNA